MELFLSQKILNMKRNIIYLLICLIGLLAVQTVAAQTSVIGKWKTIDDETGEEKSIVEIYEKNGKVYGKIIKLLQVGPNEPPPVCDKCPDDDTRKDKKILGMEIMRDMKKDGKEYSGGTILKPDTGKIYKCKIWVENNKLMVRGYIGFLYRTQTWEPVKG